MEQGSQVKEISDVHRLMLSAIRLEQHAKELIEMSGKLYDRAVTIAIHDAECLSRHQRVANPVPANREETE